MSYDEEIAARVREALATRSIEEKRIVGGGLGFMVNGHLCCAVTSKGLSLRVGPQRKQELLDRPHAQPHMVGQRETAAFVTVTPEGFATPQTLARWLDEALAFVQTLPSR